MRIGVNGFGRIGRRVARLIQQREGMELVAINDLSDAPTMAHLLKYDSVHGVAGYEVAADVKSISINGKKIPFHSESEPGNIPWDDYGVDFVIEATGSFKTADHVSGHLKEGVRMVIFSAPTEDETSGQAWSR